MADKSLIDYLLNVQERFHQEILAWYYLTDDQYKKICNESKYTYSPKHFKISPNHTLEAYFHGYGKEFTKGKLLAFKKDELWLMHKFGRKATYWEVPNDTDLYYFSLPTPNYKAIPIALVGLLLAGALGFFIPYLLTPKNATIDLSIDNCIGEMDKETYVVGDTATITLTSDIDCTLPNSVIEDELNLSDSSLESYTFDSYDEDTNTTKAVIKIKINGTHPSLSVTALPNEHSISFSGPNVDSVNPTATYHKDDEVELDVKITEGEDYHLPDELSSDDFTLTNCTFISATPANDTTHTKVKVKVGTGSTTKKDDCSVVLKSTIQNEHNVVFSGTSYHVSQTGEISYSGHHLNDTAIITLKASWDYDLPATSDITSSTASTWFTFDNCQFNSYTYNSSNNTADLKVTMGTSSTEITPGNCTVTAKKNMIQKEHTVTYSIGTLATGLVQSGSTSYPDGKYHNKIATIDLVIPTGKDYKFPTSVTADWFTFDNCRFDSYSYSGTTGTLKVKIGKDDAEGQTGIDDNNCSVTLKRNPNRNIHAVTMSYTNGDAYGPTQQIKSHITGIATIQGIGLTNPLECHPLTKDNFSTTASNVTFKFEDGTLSVIFDDDYAGSNYITVTCTPVKYPAVNMTYTGGEAVVTGPASVVSNASGVATITGITLKNTTDYKPLTKDCFSIDNSPANVSITDYTENAGIGTLIVTFDNSYSGGDITVTCSPQSAKKWYEYTEAEKWWEHCSNGGPEAATEDDIGQTVKVTLNGTEHEVRLIGVDHKEPGETSAQAHCTFEFNNLVSDENGYSLATYWQDTNDISTANHNYLDSSIRSALNGKYATTTEGSTKNINWFQYFGANKDAADNKHFSPNYSDFSNGAQINKGKSVLDMLPDGLASTIKPVTKKVNVKTSGNWVETDCTDKLFLLSPKEMGYTASNMETGVTTYKYYEGHTQQTEAIRIKQQVKGANGARTSALNGVDLDGYYNEKHVYAGCNSGTTGQGGYSWLRSPVTSYSYYAWYVYRGGYLRYNYVYSVADPVAPAFCI